ncbi:MAG: hypothetical protein ACREOU_11635 [Candidatus Eiseniibacteriota bacterium]
MARSDVEQFLEAAPVPLGLPVGEVERRLGPAAHVLEKDGHPIGFQYPDRGVWLVAEDGVVASISFLTGTADEGGARFDGELPGGLRVTDTPARVRELYGEPDRTQEIALPRPPRAKLLLSFYSLRAPATLTFAARSQEPGRIERIVLARRPS